MMRWRSEGTLDENGNEVIHVIAAGSKQEAASMLKAAGKPAESIVGIPEGCLGVRDSENKDAPPTFRDELLLFRKNRCHDSVCQIKIFLYHTGRGVAFVWPLLGNPGPEVQKAFSEVVIAACQKFDLQAEDFIWVRGDNHEAAEASWYAELSFGGEILKRPMNRADWIELRIAPEVDDFGSFGVAVEDEL